MDWLPHCPCPSQTRIMERCIWDVLRGIAICSNGGLILWQMSVGVNMCWRENLIIRRDGLLSVFISKAQVALLPKPKILRDLFKNFSEPRFQPTSQFPPKNTYHVHTGLFFLMCDYCLRDKHKKFLKASLSWHLVSSHLKILTTCKQDFFFFIYDYCLRDIPKKLLKASLSWWL